MFTRIIAYAISFIVCVVLSSKLGTAVGRRDKKEERRLLIDFAILACGMIIGLLFVI